ncbi:hypothetical protein [Paeniclostridium hominis]|uniref:hypothetical protein n=1 Tax=Paeniclostridium hominis TaxID=2764329 RepID=UPI0022E27B08|nr:hypothetical protein [Paeniclostridium hominis]
MNLDLLFKILIAILAIGIIIKCIRFIGGILFRIALIGLCILFLYNLLIHI